MERIIKLFLLIIILLSGMNVYAQDAPQMNLSTLITSQNVSYETCTKVFNTNCVSLLYLAVAAINANRFTIDEIQTKSGYVLFTAVNKQFLAMVSNVNTNQAMLRITPADDNYYFQPGIVLNVFKYIEMNLNAQLENINLK